MPVRKRLEPDAFRELESLDVNPALVISAALRRDVAPMVLARVGLDLLRSGFEIRDPEKWAAYYEERRRNDPRMVSRSQMESAQMRGQWSGLALYAFNRAGEMVPVAEANSTTWAYRKKRKKGKRERGWVKYQKIKSRAGHFVVSLHPVKNKMSVSFFGGVHHDGVTMDWGQVEYAMRKAKTKSGLWSQKFLHGKKEVKSPRRMPRT